MKNGPGLVTEDDVDRAANEERMDLRCAPDHECFSRLECSPSDQPTRPLERCAGPTDAVGKDILAPLVYQPFGHVD